MPLVCWDYSAEEQRLHILFKVMGVMARLPCCLTTPSGSTLLTCGLAPHSQ
jgi:hypothetical protein